MKWEKPPNGMYSGNMTIMAVVTYNETEVRKELIEIGAFYGEECRGTDTLQYIPNLDRYLSFMVVYGDASVPLTLKVYDHETETEYEADNDTIQYITNASYGDPFNPFVVLVSFEVFHIITATADENGTIEPEGEIIVSEGDEQTFSFIPKMGYFIEQVLVDGENIPDAVATGTYTFLNVTEPHTIEVTFSLISEAPLIITTQLPNGIVDTLYNQFIEAVGDTPLTWHIKSDSLPNGLTINEATGEISGIPTKPGSFLFTIIVSNLAGSDTASFTITIFEIVGIVETLRATSLQIYPNPTKDELRITNIPLQIFEGVASQSGDGVVELRIENIEIYDIMGKFLNSQFSILNSQFSIDVSHLSAGIYFLKITTTKGLEVHKFVKQ